jgi:hypothetical protein
MLGADVVAVGAEPAEIGRARRHQLRPPVREVRRHLDADVGHQPAGLPDQLLEILDRDLVSPTGGVQFGAVTDARAPVLGGGLCGDLRGLLPVVALVRDEVLDDDLLQVPELAVHRRERLERTKAILRALTDAEQNPAGERDLQLTGGADRVQTPGGVLGRRSLVRDQVGVDRFQHQAL